MIYERDLLINSLTLISCSVSKIEGRDPAKSNIEYLYPIMGRYYSNYDLIKREDYKYSTLYNAFYAVQIKSDHIGYDQVVNINNKLIEDGWSLIKNEKFLFQYCYGRNLVLEIIAPLESSGNISGDIGIPLESEWNIALS